MIPEGILSCGFVLGTGPRVKAVHLHLCESETPTRCLKWAGLEPSNRSKYENVNGNRKV